MTPELLEVWKIVEKMKGQDNRATANPLYAVKQKRRIYGVEADYKDGDEIISDCDELDESVGYKEINEIVQVFFSNKGAEQYIEENGHNLNNPFVYVMSAYRNKEMIAVIEYLESLQKGGQDE